jgi:hypothetical protein
LVSYGYLPIPRAIKLVKIRYSFLNHRKGFVFIALKTARLKARAFLLATAFEKRELF